MLSTRLFEFSLKGGSSRMAKANMRGLHFQRDGALFGPGEWVLTIVAKDTSVTSPVYGDVHSPRWRYLGFDPEQPGGELYTAIPGNRMS